MISNFVYSFNTMSCTMPPLFRFVGDPLPVYRADSDNFHIFQFSRLTPKWALKLIIFDILGGWQCYDRVGVYLARPSVQHLVILEITKCSQKLQNWHFIFVLFSDNIDVLKRLVKDLEEKQIKCQQEKEGLEKDFGQKRAKFKELFLQKEGKSWHYSNFTN